MNVTTILAAMSALGLSNTAPYRAISRSAPDPVLAPTYQRSLGGHGRTWKRPRKMVRRVMWARDWSTWGGGWRSL
jgi:hypothetical protein